MNPEMFNIGGISIRWYSVLILVGIIVALLLAQKEGKKFKLPDEFIFDLAFWVVIFGIVGARLYYVIFNFSLYKNDLLGIFKVWNGGLAIHGGIIAGLITLLVYCKIRKVNPFRMTDIAVPSLIIAQAIGRWGNFFNSEAHGPVTTLANLESFHIPKFIIDGMYILGEYRQPTFFYESVGCIFGFIAMLIIRCGKYLKRGNLTAFYRIWYGTLRFLIEGLRTDSLMIGPIKMAQLVSLIFVIIGLIIFVLNLTKNINDENLYRKAPKKVAMTKII